MTISREDNGTETIITIEGWLDTESSASFMYEIEKIDENTETLIIEMSKLEYISSSGIRALVAAHKKMRGNIVVRNVPENVLKVLASIGISGKLRIE